MNILWHKDNQELVRALTSRESVAQYNWILRDVIPVDLYIVQRQAVTNTPFAVTDINAGESIRFGAKAAYADTEFLFSQSAWIASGSGATRKYSAQITLNTENLITAMAAVDALIVKAEFVVILPDNSNALSTQFNVQITRDVVIGTEGVPVSEIPVIEQFTDTDGTAKVRLVNSLGQTVFVAAPL